MNKYFILIVLIGVAILPMSPSVWACGDIGVLSTDARFVVLDGDTLRLRDVGNLWWLGIREIISPIPGSSLIRAIVLSDRVVDTVTGTFRDEYYRAGGYFALTQLEREYSTPSEIASMVVPEGTLGMKRIIADAMSYLVLFSREGDEWTVSLLDTSFKTLDHWESPEMNLSGVAGCVDSDGKIRIGGLDHQFIIDPTEGTFERSQRTDRSRGYLVSDISIRCKALVGKTHAEDESIMDRGILDMERNRVISEFSSKRYARHVLFSDATLLLQQEVRRVPVPNTAGFRSEPTNIFRVIDTRTGNIVLERTLDIAPGEIHQQVICQGGIERAVIRSPKAVHLLDLNTLEIVATQEVPFDRYFILGGD